MKVHSIGQSITNHQSSTLKHVTKSIAGLALGTGLLLTSCQSKVKQSEADSFQKENTEIVEPDAGVKKGLTTGEGVVCGLFGALCLSCMVAAIKHRNDTDWWQTPYE